MVRAWHVVFIIGLVIFLSIIAALESGVILTPYYFYPLILVVLIAGIGYLIFKVVYKKEAPLPTFGAKLTIDSVKYIAAMHLLNHHGIDLFAGYPSNPKSAKYTIRMIADRCYPSPGQEAWFVRFTLRDKRYFDGSFTRVIIYIDSEGDVTNDPIMNEKTFIDMEQWHQPQIWFTKPPSKTKKPRTFEQILAERYEETGKFPEEAMRKPEEK